MYFSSFKHISSTYEPIKGWSKFSQETLPIPPNEALSATELCLYFAKNLQVIDLDYLQSFKHLLILDLKFCERITRLELNRLPYLDTVLLYGCNKIEVLTVEDCPHLNSVDAAGLEIPKANSIVLVQLNQFRLFTTKQCPKLATIYLIALPTLFFVSIHDCSSLKMLSIEECQTLKVTSLSKLDSIEGIQIKFSPNLKSIQSLVNLKSLQRLFFIFKDEPTNKALIQNLIEIQQHIDLIVYLKKRGPCYSINLEKCLLYLPD